MYLTIDDTLELKKYGIYAISCFENCYLGLLYELWLDELANGSCSNEEQNHNISLPWTKFPIFSVVVMLTISNTVNDTSFNKQHGHGSIVFCMLLLT
jgi:hypothetical protein